MKKEIKKVTEEILFISLKRRKRGRDRTGKDQSTKQESLQGTLFGCT